MRGPFVETVLLLLLVVFFGIQQRQRPQLYFRIWTVGWIFVFLSLTVWEAQLPSTSFWMLLLQEGLRCDLLLVAGFSFAVALVLTRDHLRRSIGHLLALGLPTLVAIDLQNLPGIPDRLERALLLLLVVGPELGAILMVQRSMPPAWRIRRIAFSAICAVFAGVILVDILNGHRNEIYDVLLAQTFLFAGIHYGATFGRTFSGIMGSVGFCFWALFYLLPTVGFSGGVPLHMLYTIWNVPKYFVGFSMALRVLEVDGEEKASLLEELQVLYTDFKGLYESHPQPVWIHAGREEYFLSTNTAAQKAYGFSSEEFLALRPIDLEAPWDAEFDEMQRQVPALPDDRRVCHCRKDGRKIWMNLAERPIVFQGREAQMVVARDVTDRLRRNQQLAFKAHHDPLTGLPNRALLEERLEHCLAASQRDDRRAAVLAIDVDHFKSVNDAHGHIVGDACLRAVAARLQSRVRQADTLARIGGEEFIAVIGRLQSIKDAEKVAMSLLQQFKETIKLEECDLPVTVSIGVAIYPEDGETGEELRKHADEALYEAKRRGRACVVMAQEMFEQETVIP